MRRKVQSGGMILLLLALAAVMGCGVPWNDISLEYHGDQMCIEIDKVIEIAPGVEAQIDTLLCLDWPIPIEVLGEQGGE